MTESPEQINPSEADAIRFAEGRLDTETVIDCVDVSTVHPKASIISIVTLSLLAILPNPPLEENVIVFTPAKDCIIPPFTLNVYVAVAE